MSLLLNKILTKSKWKYFKIVHFNILHDEKPCLDQQNLCDFENNII